LTNLVDWCIMGCELDGPANSIEVHTTAGETQRGLRVEGAGTQRRRFLALLSNRGGANWTYYIYSISLLSICWDR